MTKRRRKNVYDAFVQDPLDKPPQISFTESTFVRSNIEGVTSQRPVYVSTKREVRNRWRNERDILNMAVLGIISKAIQTCWKLSQMLWIFNALFERFRPRNKSQGTDLESNLPLGRYGLGKGRKGFKYCLCTRGNSLGRDAKTICGRASSRSRFGTQLDHMGNGMSLDNKRHLSSTYRMIISSKKALKRSVLGQRPHGNVTK